MPEWSNGVDCKSIVRRFESYPALKIGDIMKITDLVSKLEKIESKSDGEARELCGRLIDDLIEYDLKMEKFMRQVNRDVLKEEENIIDYLMKEGIKSGSIGEA